MMRRYIDTTHCPICLLEFWSRERVINHAKKCKVCNENILMTPPILTQDQADAVDEMELKRFKALKARGLRRHAAVEPCVQAMGPKLPIIIDPRRASAHHPLGVGYDKRV